MTIDPTARIEDGAVIGVGTSIGPYCIVGSHVVIGPDCKLISHVHIAGQTTIGAGCTDADRHRALCLPLKSGCA